LALKKQCKKEKYVSKKWLVSLSCDDELAYGQYKSVYKRVALEAKCNNYKRLFDCKTNAVEKLWSNLNIICSFTSRAKTTISQLVVNDVTLSNPQDICNALNDYFLTIGSTLLA
jgi:hypothetical protein